MVFYFDSFNAFFAIFTEIFIYTIYYFETENKKPTIIDCGANIGIATMYFKYLYPNATITSFEPDRETFKLLEKNIHENWMVDVTLVNKAVSWQEGELLFYSQSNMQGWPGNSLEKSQADFSEQESYKVSVTTLSKLDIEYIDMLKIDIEWSEWQVFKDIERSNLIQKIGRMSIEYHYDNKIIENRLSEILGFLEAKDMEIFINCNRLVTLYVEEKEFSKWNNRYVLMLDTYHRQ